MITDELFSPLSPPETGPPSPVAWTACSLTWAVLWRLSLIFLIFLFHDAPEEPFRYWRM